MIRLISTVSVAALCVAPALVQTTNNDLEQSDNVIIVTAQKRDQNLQSVPLAITAITGEELSNRGIDSVTDLDTSVPGFNIAKSGSDARPSIRGVRTEEVDLFNDPTIGFFVDGIYKPRTSQALAAFVDLERVEVLRGPQGTLFGRNTYGGSISAITKKPEFEFGAQGSVQYGNFDDLRIEGVLNAPLGDDTAIRLVGLYQQSDGYVNVLPSRLPSGRTAKNFNDNDQFYLRGSFLHESGPGQILLTISHWEQSGFGAGGFGYTTVGTLRNAAGELDLGGTLDRNNPRAGAAAGPSDTGPYDVFRDTDLNRDTNETTATLQASLDLGGSTFRSISGYANFGTNRIGDEDFSDAAASLLELDTQSTSISQEFQLLSNNNSPFQWVAGLYYFYENGVEDFIFTNLQNGSAFTYLQEADTDSYAAYAQIDYAFTDQFKLTLGGRYTRDDKRFRFRTPSDRTQPNTDNMQDFDKLTYRVAAEFAPTDNNLFYASVSTGFRSGGSNNQFAPTPIYGIQTITAYEVGTKNTFANGFGKANLSFFYNDLDDILSNSFIDVGGTTIAARSNSGSARSYGAEAELSYEFEYGLNLDASLSYLNAEFQNFQVSAPSGYNNLTGFKIVPGTTNQLDLSGNKVPLSPQFTAAIGARYDIDLGGAGTLTPAARFYFSDSYFVNEFNYDAGINGRDVGKQGSYTKTDATLTYMAPGETLMVQAFIRSIENEAVLNRAVIGGQGAIFQNYAEPRTYGIKAGFKF